MVESVRQGERQLLSGRQVIGRRGISSGVPRNPEMVQEIDVLVLFVACVRDKRKKNGFRIIKKRTQYVIIIVRIDRTRARNAIYAHGGDDNNNRRDDNNNLYESV